MGLTHYWTGSVFVAEWTLTATGGSVTGTITRPDNTTAAMGVDGSGDPLWLLSYQAAAPGRHVARLEASGSVAGAEEVSFIVKRSLVGLAPIELDPTQDVGYVRLLITDVIEDEPIFEDSVIEAVLDRCSGKHRLAAATLLEVIARSEALVSKRITTQDLSTDGPAVAKELREGAASLRKEQKDLDDEADSDDFGLLVVPLASFPCAPWYGDVDL